MGELGLALGRAGRGGGASPPHPTPPSQVAFLTKPTTQAGPAQDLAAGAA